MKKLNFCLIGALCWFFISCGRSEPLPVAKAPVPAPASVPKTDVAAVVATPVALEANKIETLFQYNPEGRRDPFKSIIVSSEKQKSVENLPPLQRKEVSELKLIGIVWGGFGYGAVIQTPDGKGYAVRKGTRVGLNNGTISQITDKEIVIKEKYLDMFNEPKMKEIVMELHPRKEGLE
jgi:type IV pilus assembly protein PilP